MVYLLLCSRADLLSTKLYLEHERKTKEFYGGFYCFNLFIYIKKTMSEDIRKMIDKVKNFKQFVNENSDGDLYYHGSCKDFNRFENIGNNASTTMFGNKLSVQGNFLTKNRRFAELFAKTVVGSILKITRIFKVWSSKSFHLKSVLFIFHTF